jgi:hypothetical protein
MATETKEKTETTVEANAKCVALIKHIEKNAAEGAALFVKLGKTARAEADRIGLDENETRKMLALSWREAQGFTSQDETLQSAFDQTQRPNISKAMRIAYPVNDEAAKAVDGAIAHNEKIGTGRGRIGVNRILDMARGHLTLAEAKAGKAKTRNANASTSASLDSTVPPAERFHNAVAGLIREYKGKLDIEQIEKIFAQIVKERKQEPAKS